MSSPKPHPKRPTWFQDVKSGCEKQTDYFVKIRKLQKELINREQHNLVNAMERLKQLQYPRRKPVVRNFALPQASSSGWPKRPLNARQDSKRQRPRADNHIKALEGKHLLPDRQLSIEEEIAFSLEDIKRMYSRMLPVLNDNQIAKIVHEVRSTFPNEPSTYLLQPHLPSIPSVKRKANARIENRLKLLTLANESDYLTTIPKIATPVPRQRRNESLTATPDPTDTNINIKKTESKKILTFDIDPSDSSVFTHSRSKFKHTDDDDDDDSDEDDDDVVDSKGDGIGPLPPPNSRPGSYMSNDKPIVENESHVVEHQSGSLVEDQVEENTPELQNPSVEEVSQEQAIDMTEDQDQSKEVDAVEDSEIHGEKSPEIETADIVEPKVTIINNNGTVTN